MKLSGERRIHWGHLAFLAGTTALGAAAGAFAGLHTGVLPKLVGWALVPGAVLGGAVAGGLAGEALELDNLGQTSGLGAPLWGGLLGGVAGVTQACFAGGTASPILAATLGLTGAFTGLSAGARILSRLSRTEAGALR